MDPYVGFCLTPYLARLLFCVFSLRQKVVCHHVAVSHTVTRRVSNVILFWGVVGISCALPYRYLIAYNMKSVGYLKLFSCLPYLSRPIFLSIIMEVGGELLNLPRLYPRPSHWSYMRIYIY